LRTIKSYITTLPITYSAKHFKIFEGLKAIALIFRVGVALMSATIGENYPTAALDLY
jgi:hypothetical protein